MDETEIIVPISVDISETALVSFVVTGSVLLTVAGLGFSCPSGSTCWASFTFLFFNDTATTEIYTLSLHDALPIYAFLEKAMENPMDRGVW